MKVHILFCQRHNQYPGQHSPEAIEVIDEYSMEDNPEWINHKRDELMELNEFSSAEIITVNLGESAIWDIDKILNSNPVIDGEMEVYK